MCLLHRVPPNEKLKGRVRVAVEHVIVSTASNMGASVFVRSDL